MQERKIFWIKTEIEIIIKTKNELKNFLNGEDMAITNSKEITDAEIYKNIINEIKGKMSFTIKNITLKGIVAAFLKIIKHCIQKLFNNFF